jgi:hypothetical protein
VQIDISTQRAKVKISLKIKNDERVAASTFVFCDPAEDAIHRAVIQVRCPAPPRAPMAAAARPQPHVRASCGTQVTQGDVQLSASPAAESPAGVSCVELALQPALAKGKTAQLELLAVYTKVLHPRPAEVAQGEPQRVVYSASAYLLSPYKVARQSTKVRRCLRHHRCCCTSRAWPRHEAAPGRVHRRPAAPPPLRRPTDARLRTHLPARQVILASPAKVEAFTEVEPTERKGKNINYGPYSNTEPFATAPITGAPLARPPAAHSRGCKREREVGLCDVARQCRDSATRSLRPCLSQAMALPQTTALPTPVNHRVQCTTTTRSPS